MNKQKISQIFHLQLGTEAIVVFAKKYFCVKKE